MTPEGVQCARSSECVEPATRTWISPTFGVFVVCETHGAELDALAGPSGQASEGNPA